MGRYACVMHRAPRRYGQPQRAHAFHKGRAFQTIHLLPQGNCASSMHAGFACLITHAATSSRGIGVRSVLRRVCRRRKREGRAPQDRRTGGERANQGARECTRGWRCVIQAARHAPHLLQKTRGRQKRGTETAILLNFPSPKITRRQPAPAESGVQLERRPRALPKTDPISCLRTIMS